MYQRKMGKYWLTLGGLGAFIALSKPQVRRATGEFVSEFIWMWLQQQQAQSALLPPPQTLSGARDYASGILIGRLWGDLSLYS